MDIWKPAFLVLVIVQVTFAQITWTAPLGGDLAATSAIPEDSTTAVTAETLAAASGTGGYTYAIVSIDGTTTSTSDMFELSTADLQNKASSRFDYETKKTYVIIVTAVDSATPPLTGTATVTVQISDIDEQTSTFPSTCGYATADALDGDVVGNYYVSDGDVNSAIAYSITSGDDAGAAAKFAMASATGILTKSDVPFDTATKSSYALVVEARGVVLTATVTITVDIGTACSSGVLGLGASVGTFTLLAAFLLYQIV